MDSAFSRGFSGMGGTGKAAAISIAPSAVCWQPMHHSPALLTFNPAYKDNQKFALYNQILDRVRQLHQIMKAAACCPVQTIDPLDTKRDDLETAEAKLREAEVLVGSMVKTKSS